MTKSKPIIVERIPDHEISMICGYKRTGKDTFVNYVTSGIKDTAQYSIYAENKHIDDSDEKDSFYRMEKQEIKVSQKEVIDFSGGVRMAFADTLKDEVRKRYSIPCSFDESIDKETPLFDGKSFRDLCIEIANERRLTDHTYWSKKAFLNRSKNTKKLLVSDFRFFDELLYMCSTGNTIKTYRIFRSEISIPKILLEVQDPEHSLDNFRTDYLIVIKNNSKEEFKKAKEVFPNLYNTYIHVCDI